MSDRRQNRTQGNGDAARLLLAAARERFAVAATDLLLPEQSRLTEWQRITAAALLGRFVRTVEDGLRAGLAARLVDHDALHAALSSASVPIALPLLERASALKDAELGTILLRRVEEHRYWKAAVDSGLDTDAWLGTLVRGRDRLVAAQAMSLLIARSRRFDHFHDPILADTELPAEIQHRLVWMVAAALRQYMVEQHRIGSAHADAAIADVAEAYVASYDEGETLEAAATRLARLLALAGRLGDAALIRMLEEAMLPLFIAAIGVRAGLEHAASWEVLSDPRGLGQALLLRAASVERDAAAAILLILNSRGKMFSGTHGDAVAAQLEIYDAHDEDLARGVLRLWQVDPGYRAAISRLSTRARSSAAEAA